MGRCWPWHHCGTRILCVDSCHLARTVVTRLIGIFEPRLLEDASQLLGTARFDGWKVCKDAFQLLASAFVHSVECAVSLQGCFSASCFCTSALLRLASVWKKKQTVHPIHLPLTGWIPSMHSNSVHVNVCAEYEASVSWVYYNTKSSFLFLLNPWTHPYRHP